ncbi:MAG: hypothetical protein ACI835_004357 [Planctomycetota bacterium]|jgi:hypothetical protein
MDRSSPGGLLALPLPERIPTQGIGEGRRADAARLSEPTRRLKGVKSSSTPSGVL